MADDRKEKTAESQLNDVIAGDDELGRESKERDVNDRAADEQRAWGGDFEARKRRGREEMHNDARGDDSDLAWGAGGLARDDRTDSVTAIPADDRAMHDEELGATERDREDNER